MPKPRIIGIVGEGAQSGKTTAAMQIAQSLGHSVNIPFAYALKRMVVSMLTDLGMTHGLAEAHVYGHLKEQPVALLGGKLVREVMQTLGTDWGRDMILSTLWTDCWEKRAKEVIETGANITCDDVRFMNEVITIQQYDGLIIKIKGKSKNVDSKTNQHASETQGIPDDVCDAVIENNGSLADLREAVEKTMTRLLAFS